MLAVDMSEAEPVAVAATLLGECSPHRKKVEDCSWYNPLQGQLYLRAANAVKAVLKVVVSVVYVDCMALILWLTPPNRNR